VQPIVVSGQFTGRPDQRGAVCELARSIYPPSRGESGYLSFACFAQADRPDAFLFFEEWRDQTASDAHFATPHFAAFMERFRGLDDSLRYVGGGSLKTIGTGCAGSDTSAKAYRTASSSWS
jgi:quinol monooxygenase YgiN